MIFIFSQKSIYYTIMRYILLSTIIFVVSCTLQATYKEIDIKASKNNDKHIKVEVKEKNEG